MNLINIECYHDNPVDLNFRTGNSITTNFNVFVKDNNGNGIPNYRINLTAPDGGTIHQPSGLTNNNGVFTTEITLEASTTSIINRIHRIIINGIKTYSMYVYRDTGWLSNIIDFGSGWGENTNFVSRMRVQNHVVSLGGGFIATKATTTSSGGGGTKIGTLKYPQFAAPNAFWVMNRVNANKYVIEISEGGGIWLTRFGTTTGNANIGVNTQFLIACSYLTLGLNK